VACLPCADNGTALGAGLRPSAGTIFVGDSASPPRPSTCASPRRRSRFRSVPPWLKLLSGGRLAAPAADSDFLGGPIPPRNPAPANGFLPLDGRRSAITARAELEANCFDLHRHPPSGWEGWRSGAKASISSSRCLRHQSPLQEQGGQQGTGEVHRQGTAQLKLFSPVAGHPHAPAARHWRQRIVLPRVRSNSNRRRPLTGGRGWAFGGCCASPSPKRGMATTSRLPGQIGAAKLRVAERAVGGAVHQPGA